jgi:hypothetical protein
MDQESVVQSRIERFKADLPRLPISSIVRKHITFGDSYILDPDDYFDLKAEVAEHFEIHPSEVIVVGSGKLGFSIVNEKRYRHFGEGSDLDVAIISPDLFEKIWQSVYDYRNEVGYWARENEFKNYLFRGWIRPDMLPPSSKFSLCKDWWDFFRSLAVQRKYGPYKIAAGLYRSWHFLENYQSICVMGCASGLEAEE